MVVGPVVWPEWVPFAQGNRGSPLATAQSHRRVGDWLSEKVTSLGVVFAKLKAEEIVRRRSACLI